MCLFVPQVSFFKKKIEFIIYLSFSFLSENMVSQTHKPLSELNEGN